MRMNRRLLFLFGATMLAATVAVELGVHYHIDGDLIAIAAVAVIFGGAAVAAFLP